MECFHYSIFCSKQRDISVGSSWLATDIFVEDVGNGNVIGES